MSPTSLSPIILKGFQKYFRDLFTVCNCFWFGISIVYWTLYLFYLGLSSLYQRSGIQRSRTDKTSDFNLHSLSIPVKDLQLDAKVSESDDDEGHTMTTEFNSENNIEYSS